MNLDLNLLRVLDVMLEEQSVTRTGSRLGLSQSAVSHALNRLRYMLGDELFVRRPTGMQPTQRAMDMGPQVHAALTQLQAALAPADFDPATSDRRFTLAAGAFVTALLAPPLVNALVQAAPMTELLIAEPSPDIVDHLDARRVDFTIGSVLSAPERFTYETIVTERLAWVVRAGHPLLDGRTIDLKALASVPHLVISASSGDQTGERDWRRTVVNRPTWEDAGALETVLAQAGLSRRIGATVPDAFAAMAITAQTNMTALLPRRLALLSAQRGVLQLIEPPYDSPTVDVTLLYLRERMAEPAIAWMRDLIRNVAATL